MRHLRRRAVSGVVLLVVIAIIGIILVSIIVIGMIGSREAVRRNNCTNNLKILGVASQAYLEQNKRFPPSSMWEQPEDIETPNSPKLKANWVIQLLPYIDAQPLADMFDHSPGTYINDDKTPAGANFNQEARSTWLSVLQCSSDPNNAQNPYNGKNFGQGDGWARGNYAANAGPGFMAIAGSSQCGAIEVDGIPSGCAALPDSPGWTSVVRGVMGASLQLKRGGLVKTGGLGQEDIKDGMSNTILIGEIRAGVTESDPRGVWAMSGGPSSLWACTSVGGGDNGPNANRMTDGDSFPQCSHLVFSADELRAMGLPCNFQAKNSPHWQQTVRSIHPGGANVAMCDGSVRFIADTVEQGATNIRSLHTDRHDQNRYNLNSLRVWDRLIMPTDRQEIRVEDF